MWSLVCYWCFHTIFNFVVSLYKYQNVFKSIPANIGSWLGKKKFDSSLLTESLCSTINVRCPKPCHTSLWCYMCTRYFRFTVDVFFVLDFFISLMCLWLEKNGVLFICIHKWVKSSHIDCFRLVHKDLRWIESNNFKIYYVKFEALINLKNKCITDFLFKITFNFDGFF